MCYPLLLAFNLPNSPRKQVLLNLILQTRKESYNYCPRWFWFFTPLPVMTVHPTLCVWLFSRSSRGCRVCIPDQLTLSLAMCLALATGKLVNGHRQRLLRVCMVWLCSLSSCDLPWTEPNLGSCSSKNHAKKHPQQTWTQPKTCSQSQLSWSLNKQWPYQPADPQAGNINKCLLL